MSTEEQALSLNADQRGRAYKSHGLIFREIKSQYSQFYLDLLNKEQVLSRLYEKGLVEAVIHQYPSHSNELILRHRSLPFVSFWKEWSFGMIRDAALQTIELAKELELSGVSMYDAHPYNIIYDFGKPVFVDWTSIRQPHECPFRVWRSSFFYEFVIPLFLESRKWNAIKEKFFFLEDVPLRKATIGNYLERLYLPWKRFIADNSRVGAYEKIREYIGTIKNHHHSSQWEDYYRRDSRIVFGVPSSYTDKEKSVITFLQRLKDKNCRTVLDIASNEGWFSLASEEMGYEVVAFDYDVNAIESLYQKIKGTNKRILPLAMDFTTPTRAHGPNNIWPSAIDRFKCDITLSIAVLHHLALSQGVTFEQFTNTIASLTNRYAVVEFIDRSDIHIQKMVRGKEQWYKKEFFLSTMDKYFELIEVLPSEPSTRQIFLFKKK